MRLPRLGFATWEGRVGQPRRRRIHGPRSSVPCGTISRSISPAFTPCVLPFSGRVSTVLGAFQVADNGDLANWSTPRGSGGIGGAMDLVAGGTRVIAICYHREKGGAPKLVRELSYPPTARGCVTSVVTDLAWIDVDAEGFLLREIAPGVRIDDVKAATAAPLRVASDVGEMQFG
jgi:acyl CoA:acetate/3-ketoacid CoA transferase beta subunit